MNPAQKSVIRPRTMVASLPAHRGPRVFPSAAEPVPSARWAEASSLGAWDRSRNRGKTWKKQGGAP